MAHRPTAPDWIVRVAAIEAGATGLLLLASPPLFARLVLGAGLPDAGPPLGRLAGIALLALALAGWRPTVATLRAQAIYNLLAGAYLTWLGIAGLGGILLWPAVVLHLGLAVLIGRAWMNARRA
ncbi:hypothetical protein [Caulobacter sp. 17J80-11]|uniref:hypothetical protein n=1 Tax=Caulobacter sp. 17J80-11 TaxID=2763502 RepID=UPI00165389D3|nr:hypothetical protein [Caulobacter sp. 17J80-11]MBC6981195.1 hypothetical protein [Caulobacter sp. 17J80-11]